MTKTTTVSSALDRLTGWLGPEAGPILYDYLLSAVRKSGAPVYTDVDKTILELYPPLFLGPPPTGEGCYFDIERVDHFIRFCRLLRHIKGKHAKAGARLELDLWQVIFIVAPVFGWRQEDGRRVRRSLYFEVGKKNGKSTLAAALCLYLLTADGEQGAEVGTAAGDRDQARAVGDVAWAMVRNAPALAKRLRLLKNQITYEETSSWFKVFSGDGAQKAGLNLHGVVIDELLVQKTRELVDNLEGATAAREQPLVVYLSTGGLDDPGSIYNEKRNYAERVAKGDLQDDSWHTVIFTVEREADWTDPENWRRANPGLGISIEEAFLKRKCEQAKASPSSKNKFLRDHLNVRTGQVTAWIDIKQYDRSGSDWLYPKEWEHEGRPAYLGLDLSSTTDLAALSIVVPQWMPDPKNPDLEVETLCRFLRVWTPGDTLEQRAEKDQAPYQEWADAGLLTVVEGNVIDYDAIEKEIFKLADFFDLRRLHFDRWGSKQLVQHVRDELGHNVVFEMGQGFASMSPALKEMEKLILQRRWRHGANPVGRFSVQSLAVKTDPAGNIKPDRDRSTGRIDPFVADAMAVDAWSRDPAGESAYEPNARSETA